MPRIARRSTVVYTAAVIALVSCGREVTGPASGGMGRMARLALDPRMPTVSASLDGPAPFSRVVPFDRVRVTAMRGDESMAYDRTVAFPSTEDSIALTITLPLEANSGSGSQTGEGTPVFIGLAYVNAQGDTVFRGGPTTAFVSGTSSNQTVTVPVRYSGVGSGATSVQLTPDSGSVLAGTTSTLVAVARDSSGVLAGTPFLFYTPDTARAVITNPGLGGVQWKASRGTARIIALHPNGMLADTALFTVSLPASKLVVSSGGAQSAQAGSSLAQPIVLRTLASDDVPVPGVIVNFSVATGGGALSAVQDTSDANGNVSVNWTLGAALGPQSITATATGLAPSPVTVSATALSGPTGISLNITSPVGAKRYYAVVTGGGQPVTVHRIDPRFARTASMNVALPAATGYTVYVLAADSLSTQPDTLPLVAAGVRLVNLTIPAGNTVTLHAALQPMTLEGTVPSSLNAGESFLADATLTDPSGLFYDIVTSVSLFRSDVPAPFDRGGVAMPVAEAQTLSATQKRFTASLFRPTATGTIYSQYSIGVVPPDRSVIFWLTGPSRERGDPLLTTVVAAATTGIRVNVTSPVPVTRFVVGVDTGTGPIAWGGVTGSQLTSASIDVPVPAGSSYRVRVAALDDFGFSLLTSANLAGLRAGGVALNVPVATGSFTAVPMTLALQTAAAGVPSVGSSGVTINYSGTMRDPSLFNSTTGCLMRYSTTGPITSQNLGTFLGTGCTISNRLTDGTYTVTGSFPAITGPATLHTHVFTSVIGYQANGARIEMVHQAINVTTIPAP